MAKTEVFKSAGVTVDVVLFTIESEMLHALFIKRTNNPYKGLWAFPGGFMQERETAEGAAARILKEKAGVKDIYIEQLYTFTDLRRDPRGRVISITHFALVPKERIMFTGSDLQTPTLFPVHKISKLAFDHKEILAYSRERLRAKLEYTNIVYSLLKPRFTLTQLQQAYEIILGKKLDKRNFRKKYFSLGLVRATKEYERGGRRRPARLYEFQDHELAQLKKFF
ncbi:MAG: NUDIX domain-containing protein [bacterium]|nr:NUDIX domain-containing protein [bacterium]